MLLQTLARARGGVSRKGPAAGSLLLLLRQRPPVAAAAGGAAERPPCLAAPLSTQVCYVVVSARGPRMHGCMHACAPHPQHPTTTHAIHTYIYIGGRRRFPALPRAGRPAGGHRRGRQEGRLVRLAVPFHGLAQNWACLLTPQCPLPIGGPSAEFQQPGVVTGLIEH